MANCWWFLLLACVSVCSTLFFCTAAFAATSANNETSLQFSANPIATATNNASQSILESNGGQFGLKFHSRDGKLFLLAIVNLLYNETIIWSGNRNRPGSINTKLFVSTDRNLVLKDGVGDAGFTIWSANITGASRMALNPKGNLLIYNGSGGILWQSFDNPADTLVPGQWIKAGTFLVSSVSDSNTTESIYLGGVLPGGAGFFAMAPQFFPYGVLEFNTLRLSAPAAYISLYNSSCNHTIVIYSDDGLLLEYQQEGNSTQECMRETGGNSKGFSITVSTNSSEEGFRYMKMEPGGNIKLYLQTQSMLTVETDFFRDYFSDICRLPNNCGPYGICNNIGVRCTCPESSYFSQSDQASAGCKPKTELRCNSSHTFVALRGIDYFPSRYLVPLQTSLDNCKSLCLANCSCVAAFYWQSSGSCFHYEELLSMKSVSDQTQLAFIKVMGESTLPAKKNWRSRFWKQTRNIVGISLGAAFLLIVIFFYCFTLVRKRQRTRKTAAANGDDGFLKTLSVLPPRFTFEELKAITRDFSEKLGSGGFGSVYEGVLADGTMVGVKQLEEASQGYGEFRTEIATLGSLSHVNLVRLRGFCAEESHHLLVYEYMANRSLDGWLFSEDIARLLSWGTRLSIAIDTARGLAFLHEECRECIVHLDVKPENILLDDKFRAKLSDFGLSKLIDRTSQQSRVLTGMRGTPGYLAPEWLMETGVSSKSDVYSLGIVLLEMLSGRRCVDLLAPAVDSYLPAATMRRFLKGQLMEILDPRLMDGGVPEEDEMRKVVMVALWCIQEEPGLRPKASAVSRMLEGHMQIQEPPVGPLLKALSKQRNIWISAAAAGDAGQGS